MQEHSVRVLCTSSAIIKEYAKKSTFPTLLIPNFNLISLSLCNPECTFRRSLTFIIKSKFYLISHRRKERHPPQKRKPGKLLAAARRHPPLKRRAGKLPVRVTYAIKNKDKGNNLLKNPMQYRNKLVENSSKRRLNWIRSDPKMRANNLDKTGTHRIPIQSRLQAVMNSSMRIMPVRRWKSRKTENLLLPGAPIGHSIVAQV